MARRDPREGRPGPSYRIQVRRGLRVAWRVLVALVVAAAKLAWGLADVARHVVVLIIAAAFGWRYGSR